MRRVTLVHGFLGSPADWADVLAELAPGIACDCVALADLEPWTIYLGNPAVRVRTREFDGRPPVVGA